MSNPVLNEGVSSFRNAYRKSKAPIWQSLEEMLDRSASGRVEVNLSRISKHTRSGSVVVVPGKVLGSGAIDHKITLCGFSLSRAAAKKIVDAGGKIMGIREFIEKFPEGSKVTIIG